MYIILLVILVVIIICSPFVRCFLANFFKACINLVVDIVNYFVHKKYNNASYGQIMSYAAMNSTSFGCGKSLTVVHDVYHLYRRFNNKKVWDNERKKFVTQRICILSNVSLNFPFIHLHSLKEFIEVLECNYKNDSLNDTLTVTYMIVDEAGSQMNSRSFKSNFDAAFIKTLLTSRHYKASVFLTSQRHSMIDALMRQVTNTVYCCRKVWRIELVNYYDAYEIEVAQNPALVKPYKRTAWFISNKDFALYDTFELLQDLKKSCETGDMLSEAEILTLQNNMSYDSDMIVNRSRKFKKNKKKSLL